MSFQLKKVPMATIFSDTQRLFEENVSKGVPKETDTSPKIFNKKFKLPFSERNAEDENALGPFLESIESSKSPRDPKNSPMRQNQVQGRKIDDENTSSEKYTEHGHSQGITVGIEESPPLSQQFSPTTLIPNKTGVFSVIKQPSKKVPLHLSNEFDDLFIDQSTFDFSQKDISESEEDGENYHTENKNPQKPFATQKTSIQKHSSQIDTSSTSGSHANTKENRDFTKINNNTYSHANKIIYHKDSSQNTLQQNLGELNTKPQIGPYSSTPVLPSDCTGFSNEDEELVVLEVQKKQHHRPMSNFKKHDLLKSAGKFSISKSKQNHAASAGLSKTHIFGSDKFLEPLLASISRLQMERNTLQAEYHSLWTKHSKMIFQLEKFQNVTVTLKQRVGSLIKFQNEIQEEIGALRNGLGMRLVTKVAELKSGCNSLDDNIKTIGNSLLSTQEANCHISHKISEIKAAQIQSMNRD